MKIYILIAIVLFSSIGLFADDFKDCKVYILHREVSGKNDIIFVCDHGILQTIRDVDVEPLNAKAVAAVDAVKAKE